MKTSIIKELARIVGPANLFTDPEELVAYSYDATCTAALSAAVARPLSAQEVSSILTLANRERFPVVPRGAGTGMSGGSVPVQGGLVLSFERMNRILEIDEPNRTAIVEPGVITGDLQAEVEARGLFYPPDPASHRFCTLGGNIAECAGGLRAVKYGVTRDYVLGLEVVLPTGEIIKTGSRTFKSVAGYDLTRLIVGSEGTLGVATRIILRLLPLPESVRTLSAFFPDIGSAAQAVSRIMACPVVPRALELIDSGSLRAVENYLKQDISGGAAAMVITEVDGPAAATSGEIAALAEICRQAGAMSVQQARNKNEQDRIWKLRRAISPALYTIKPRKINEDVVVPPARVPDLLAAVQEIAKRHDLLIVSFGHAGDGNIHLNIMLDEDERPRAEQAAKEIFETVLRLQGSITGEHGIGTTKAAFLPLEAGEHGLAVMRKIKQALDPNNVLNPGKIFLENQ
ncbi:MAG: FAD-binding oxidoreductase [Nitrospirota bacterium]